MSVATDVPAPQPLWFLDNLAYVHIDGEQVAGAYGLCEMVGRSGDMPPLHIHQRDDETFYVLEGELSLFVGEQRLSLTPGRAALAPRGVPHVYRVESEAARWLTVNSPAGFERFIRATGSAAESDGLPPAGPPPDPAALAQAAAEYGIELLGPPGTLPGASAGHGR